MSKSPWKTEHIGLPSVDPKRLADWYVSVLDGIVRWRDEAVPLFFVELPGGLVLEIGPCGRVVEEVRDNSVAGIRHFALRVDSIEVAREELIRRGVAFTEAIKPAGGGGRVLFFADAEGNLLHLVDRPEGAAL